MEWHSGHRIGELISAGEVFQESGEISDPMRVNYIEVTNGREVLLIRSSRKSITDPLTMCFPGKGDLNNGTSLAAGLARRAMTISSPALARVEFQQFS